MTLLGLLLLFLATFLVLAGVAKASFVWITWTGVLIALLGVAVTTIGLAYAVFFVQKLKERE